MNSATSEREVNVEYPESQTAQQLIVKDWNADDWRGQSEATGDLVNIRWKFSVSHGKQSYDYPILVEGFRHAVASVISPEGVDGIRLRVGSLPTLSTTMRDLFRWMVHSGHHTFDRLTREVIQRYIEDLPHIVVDRNAFFGLGGGSDAIEEDLEGIEKTRKASDETDVESEEGFASILTLERLSDVSSELEQEDGEVEQSGEEGEEEVDGITYGQVFARLQLLSILFAARKHHGANAIAPMPSSPFGNSTLNKVCSGVAKHVVNITPPLPDEIVLPLLKSVTDWIYSYSPDVIRLVEQYVLLRESSTVEERLKFSTDFRFGEVVPGAGPWHLGFDRDNSKGENLVRRRDGIGPSRTVGAMVRHLAQELQGACFLALLYFCGLRPSEVSSFRSDTKGLGSSGQPPCVGFRYSKDGLLELFFANGRVFKGRRRGGDAASWLLGCRPAGSDWVPPSLQALIIMEQMREPWRQQLGAGPLALVSRSPSGLTNAASQFRPVSSGRLLAICRVFIRDHIAWNELPDFSRLNEDLRRFRLTRGSIISSRHARKTFAAFILESRNSSVEAVRLHFKHLDSAITLASYFAPVHRMRQQGASEAYAASVQFFTGVLRGQKIYGSMAPLIEKYFGGEEWRKIKDTAEIYRKVDGVVRLHRIRVFFSDHGNCLIRLNPAESRCHEVRGQATLGWLADEPNYVHRTPSLCSGCPCFVMDGSHLPFWRERAIEPVSGLDTREHRVQIFRARGAAAVVNRIEREQQQLPTEGESR